MLSSMPVTRAVQSPHFADEAEQAAQSHMVLPGLGRPRLWCPVPRLGSSVFSPASLGSWLRGLGKAPAVLVASAGSGAMPAQEWDYLRGDNCFKIIPLTPVLSVTGGQGLASLGL